MDRILRQLAADGFEPLGTFESNGGFVVGDPKLFSEDDKVFAPGARPGTWHLLLRPDADDPDVIAEVVACHEDVLLAFYDAYDEAQLMAELPVESGRVALLDADLRDDLEVRKSLFEPEELPWVLDAGVVTDARPPARIFQSGGGQAELLSVAFGPAPVVSVDRIPVD